MTVQVIKDRKKMTIDLSGGNDHIAPPITMKRNEPRSSLSVSLDELLDF